MKFKIVFLLFITSLLSLALNAQNQEDQSEKTTKKEKREEKKNAEPQKGDIYFSPVPVIGANPAFGFIYGAGLAASAYFGEPKSTNLSSVLAGLAFTSKSQIIFTIKSSVYLADNKFILNGDWRYLNSSQPTWGLGTGPQSAKMSSDGFEYDDGSTTQGIDAPQMLEFEMLRFYQTVLKKVSENLYFGVGIHFDRFSNINDNLLALDSVPPVITSFYAYNLNYGFSQDKSTLVGISLNGTYDSRDNQNNPYRGRYANVSFKLNPTWLGSEKSSTTLWLEYRDYIDFKKNHHNILGFWAWGNFTTSGDLPYLLLPAIGNDQFAKSGRPYPQGRFRGRNMVYAETEFRKHILATKNNPDFLGMVAYFNITTADAKDNNISLFEYVNKGYGLGIRLNISKKARTNLGVDYGWGDYDAKGFYMRLNETF